MTTGRTGRKGEDGMALVAVLFAMVLLLGLGAAFHTGILAETTSRGAHARATSGFYAAESGINRGMDDYRNIFLAYNVPSGSDFDEHSFTLGLRTVKYQLTDIPGNPTQAVLPAGHHFAGLSSTRYRYIANSRSELVPGETEVSIGSLFDVDYIPLFQFLAFYQGDLEILPGPTMNLHGPIHTNGRLYLNTSSGTLTINELQPDIPTVHISASGDVYRGRKDANTCTGTVVIAKLADGNGDGQYDLRTMSCSGSGTTVQSSASLANWLGSIRSRVPLVSVPTPDVLDRGTGEFWQTADLRIALDLENDDGGYFPIVVLDVNGNVDATKNGRLQQFMADREGALFYSDIPRQGQVPPTGGGTCASPNLGTHCHRESYDPDFPSNGKVYACPRNDVLNLYPGCAEYVANVNGLSFGRTARRGGFYNNREHAWVYMLNLNLHALLDWNRDQSSGNQLFPPDDDSEGGVVVFLTVVGEGSDGIPAPIDGLDVRYGVRVYGSPNLDFPSGMADPTGVTVVSDQAIYIEGDYNVGDAAHPKMPAAFMGDTINVLSSNWSGNPAAWTNPAACRNDCQSRLPLNSRPAASTTIRAALLGGVTETSAGNYNGGFENYPRFHENWSSRTFNYRGSFVSLGPPSHANGAWCGTGGSCTYGTAGCPSASMCNIYNPPNRAWDYDPDFQDVADLPPLTPRVVTVQQILFTENFR